MTSEFSERSTKNISQNKKVRNQNLKINYVIKSKTFTENWNSKRHLLELSWPMSPFFLFQFFFISLSDFEIGKKNLISLSDIYSIAIK